MTWWPERYLMSATDGKSIVNKMRRFPSYIGYDGLSTQHGSQKQKAVLCRVFRCFLQCSRTEHVYLKHNARKEVITLGNGSTQGHRTLNSTPTSQFNIPICCAHVLCYSKLSEAGVEDVTCQKVVNISLERPRGPTNMKNNCMQPTSESCPIHRRVHPAP